MFPTCSCKNRQCKLDVNLISPNRRWFRWSIVDARRCSRTALQTIGDPMAMFRIRNCINPVAPAFSIFTLEPVTRQQNKRDLFFIFDLMRQPQGMWFHVKSIHLLYALHKALTSICSAQGLDFYMLCTRPWHHHDFVKTSPSRPDAYPIFVCRTPKDHRPSPMLKIHRWLLADVAPINPRICPIASPKIRRNFGDTSSNIPRRFANTSLVCFLVGPHFWYRHWSPPQHVFLIASTFGSRGTIVFLVHAKSILICPCNYKVIQSLFIEYLNKENNTFSPNKYGRTLNYWSSYTFVHDLL